MKFPTDVVLPEIRRDRAIFAKLGSYISKPFRLIEVQFYEAQNEIFLAPRLFVMCHACQITEKVVQFYAFEYALAPHYGLGQAFHYSVTGKPTTLLLTEVAHFMMTAQCSLFSVNSQLCGHQDCSLYINNYILGASGLHISIAARKGWNLLLQDLAFTQPHFMRPSSVMVLAVASALASYSSVASLTTPCNVLTEVILQGNMCVRFIFCVHPGILFSFAYPVKDAKFFLGHNAVAYSVSVAERGLLQGVPKTSSVFTAVVGIFCVAPIMLTRCTNVMVLKQVFRQEFSQAMPANYCGCTHPSQPTQAFSCYPVFSLRFYRPHSQDDLSIATADNMLAILHVQTGTSSIVLHITFIAVGLQSASLAPCWLAIFYMCFIVWRSFRVLVQWPLCLVLVELLQSKTGIVCVTVAECFTTSIVMLTLLVRGAFASEVRLHKLGSQSAYWVYWWRVNNP